MNERARALDGIRALLVLVGEDPDRDGLAATPGRVVDAMVAATASEDDPDSLLAVTFEMDADQMVYVGPTAFASICEHHLLPFHGWGHVAYIPSHGRVVGLSKIPRVLDHYAARPQVQERLAEQVADALVKALDPLGVAVVLRASHACLALRGARKADAVMTTSVMRGAFRDEAEARAEFFALLGMRHD